MSSDEGGDRPAKRPRTGPSSNLDSFVTSSRPPPVPLATTPSLTDRDSTFVGIAFQARSGKDVTRVLEHVKHVLHAEEPADHEMAAWRFLVPKAGRDGSRGPDDFTVQSGSEDDGEKYGSSKILKAMEATGVVDAVVVVSRWFGGTLLGPVRFAHITTVATDACRAFKLIDAIDDHISRLVLLDSRIGSLRQRLKLLHPSASTSPSLPPPSSAPVAPPSSTAGAPTTEDSARSTYAHLKDPPDLAKAERLAKAREGTIRALEKTLDNREAKARAAQAAESRRAAKPVDPDGGGSVVEGRDGDGLGLGLGLGIS